MVALTVKTSGWGINSYNYTNNNNTAIFFPRFPLDGLAEYIAHIHNFFFYICTSRVEPHVYTGQ